MGGALFTGAAGAAEAIEGGVVDAGSVDGVAAAAGVDVLTAGAGAAGGGVATELAATAGVASVLICLLQ